MAEGLPADLARLQRGLEESDQEALALLAELDDERLNWRPDESSWSVAQCLDHLNVANRVYLDPMRQAVEAARNRERSGGGPSIPGLWSAGSSAHWSRRRAAGSRRLARSFPLRARPGPRWPRSGRECRPISRISCARPRPSTSTPRVSGTPCSRWSASASAPDSR